MLIFEGKALSFNVFLFFSLFNMRIFRRGFEKGSVCELLNQKLVKTGIKISFVEIIFQGLWSVFSFKDLQLLLSYH